MTDGLSAPQQWSAERVLLVSGDSHVGPNLETQLRPYCPARHLEAFDEYTEAAKAFAGFFNIGPNAKTAGHNDAKVRLEEMDRDGVTAEVIFHGSFNDQSFPFMGSPFTNPANPELARAGYEIYNRWLFDFCEAAPERLIGLVHVPMWDLDAAVTQLEWAAEHGFKGVNFPVTRPGWKQYNDPSWDPIWSVAAEAGMVLTTHAGGGVDEGVQDAVGTPLMVIEGAGALNRRPIARLIVGGVFERHPNLKLAMTEQSGVWLPYLLDEMDGAVKAHVERAIKVEPRPGMTPLTRLPSDYFMTNVFVGASFMAPFEAEAAIQYGYWRNAFWGRDYPHPEGTWKYTEDPDETPLTHLSLRHTCAGLPEVETRAMLGENAISIYGLDRDKLLALADDIGPTPEQITTPLDEVPERFGPVRQGMGSSAFRTKGTFAARADRMASR